MTNFRNNVQLVGFLGGAPEVTTFENGNKVARFSLAVNNGYRDKAGEYVDKTCWNRVVAWGNLADVVMQKFTKGQEVGIHGHIDTREYNAKDGSKRYITEIVMENFHAFRSKEK